MSGPPRRLSDSDDLEPFARALLRAGTPTRPMPPASTLRGAHRVARLASVPVVALGVGLWSKTVAAAFGVGFTSALGLVALSPALQTRLFGPPAVQVTTAPQSSGAPLSNRAVASPLPPAAPQASKSEPAVTPPAEERAPAEPIHPARAHPPLRAASKTQNAEAASTPALPFTGPTNTMSSDQTAVPVLGSDGGAAPLSLAALQPDPIGPIASKPAPRDETVGAEAALLLQARRLVASDPERALVLLNRHALEFRKPALAMEREVLVIEALERSGRRVEAVQRAKGLLAAAPSALYRARLEKVIEAHPDVQ